MLASIDRHDAPVIACAEPVFLDLAAGRRGQLGQHLEPFRPVLPGDALLAEELLHLVEGELLDARACSTTQAQARSCSRGSGMPMTATEAIFGFSYRAFST